MNVAPPARMERLLTCLEKASDPGELQDAIPFRMDSQLTKAYLEALHQIGAVIVRADVLAEFPEFVAHVASSCH